MIYKESSAKGKEPKMCRDLFKKFRATVRKNHNHHFRNMEHFGRMVSLQNWDKLKERQQIANLIKKLKTENDTVFIHIDATDCDWSRSTYKREIPATVMAFVKAYDDIHLDAEGPTYVHLMTQEEAYL